MLSRIDTRQLPVALATYEPRIKTHVGQLTSYIESNLGKPVNMTKLSMFLSFDIMGSVGFSKGFRNLTSGIEHPAIKGVHDHMAILGIMSHIPWLLYLFGYIPGVSAGFIGFFTWCGDEVERKKKVGPITPCNCGIVIYSSRNFV